MLYFSTDGSYGAFDDLTVVDIPEQYAGILSDIDNDNERIDFMSLESDSERDAWISEHYPNG